MSASPRGRIPRADGIASSAFPKHEVSIGTGGDIVSETGGVIAENTPWHTAAPSRLVVRSHCVPEGVRPRPGLPGPARPEGLPARAARDPIDGGGV
jgi:hypothetical protein